MTLKTLYSKLSKIIDEKSKTDPDFLDKPVCLSIMPSKDTSDELLRCGIYGVMSVEEADNIIFISNHT